MPTIPPDYSPLTPSLVTFCQALQTLLESHAVDLGFQSAPPRFFYGVQQQYPSVPAYAVEPVRKVRLSPPRMQRIYDIEFTAQIICYFVRVDLSDQFNRAEVDTLGEKVEAFVNADHTLGGLTRDLLVTDLESGYAYAGQAGQESKYKAVILTVAGTSIEGLPC